MILIAHRGNTAGPRPDLENRPSYIEESLMCGYHAEVDVWFTKGNFYTGHDKPTYPVDLGWFLSPNKEGGRRLWVHCKNIEAAVELQNLDLNLFFHDSDECVVTSHGFVWAYPGKEIPGSISVLPEQSGADLPEGLLGVCSDFIVNYGGVHHG